MSNEGYILSIEGCPYAFSTNGIAGYSIPASEDWADSWSIMENCLVNPNDYISWNERTLPIEGDLEVDGITLKLLDKYIENFPLYDGTIFTGNILTELFTRGSARENPFFLERSLPSILQLASPPFDNTNYDNELLLFSDPGLPAAAFANNAYYNPRRISGSYDLSTTFGAALGDKPIWIEDECINIVGTAGASPGPVDPKVLLAGQSGLESLSGRGWYGTERKYHRIRETYSPEIFLKHPLVIKRGVILWRVEDAADNSVDSIYPIWRGYCQSSPELTPDGSTFELRAEHKWNTYKNEVIEYAGFRHNFSIPTKTYSKNAMYAIHRNSLAFDRTIRPYERHGEEQSVLLDYHNWDTDYRMKFTDDPANCFRGAVRYGSATLDSRPALISAINNAIGINPWQLNTAEIAGGKVRLSFASNEERDTSSTTPEQYTIGGKINGVEFWGGNINRWEWVGADSPELPLVAIDFKQNDNAGGFLRISGPNAGSPYDFGYALKYQIDGRVGTALPTRYLFMRTPSTTGLGGTNNVVLRHAYIAEDSDDVSVIMEPAGAQSELTAPNNVVVGRISKVNKLSFEPLAEDGVLQFIDKPLSFKSAVSVQSNTTVIETLFKSMFRPRGDVTLFNNINNNDFDLTNLAELNQWVSSIDLGHKIRWQWTDTTKFMDFIQPYMKFFSYIICLNKSKIKFKTYDPTRPAEHVLTTTDFLEAPVNLSTLPENLFNTMKLSAPNYETVFTFNDDLSKGRYKIGNTQEIQLPAAVGDILTTTDLIGYFQLLASRFLSIWGYPQYVFKCKTSISKINIEIGDVVDITDWLVPNFDRKFPKRGLVNKQGLVIERRVDLTTGIIEFSITYGENTDTSFYSPCVRAFSATNLGVCRMIARAEYIIPSNKLQPDPAATPVPGTFTTAQEESTYAGSNRYEYRNRYNPGYSPITPPPNLSTEDGGVSAFKVGDHVEFVWRNTTTNYIFNGATPGSLTITQISPLIREIVFNETIDPALLAIINSGGGDDYIVDLRYTDYDLCTQDQKDNYGFCGDFQFQSLDNPLPVPPAARVIPATQYAP